MLEGCVSGGCRSHYGAASPLRFCPCVPAMEIGLRDLHKAPAIHYSATELLYMSVLGAELSLPRARSGKVGLSQRLRRGMML